jgi:predicted flap endonuclease-1-like 5' DNA nuclease
VPVLAAAVIVFALSTLGLALLVEPVPTWYYHLAWWSYIVAADDVNRRLRGRSLLRDRPAHFAWLAGVSVLWWTLFELVNLRLGNWYYVMSLPWTPLRWAAGVVAFASVLPGVVETVELLENLGAPRSVRVRPLLWSRGKERAVLAGGAACLVLPLLWPDVFFPLTWGSLVFLLEPWNRRHARRSFLRDLEEGEAGPFCRTLLAGLICGALWEAWNFWARVKWTYTVPGCEAVKVFEMPLAGFLGFPPFGVECLVLLRFLAAWRDRLTPRAVRASRALALALGPLAVLGMFAAVDPVVVDSLYAPLAELDVVPAPARARLAEAGVTSPERFLRETEDDAKRRALAGRTSIPLSDLESARDRVALVMHRGIGLERAHDLAALGIHTRTDLAAWPADRLAAAIARRRPGDRRNRFLERRARVWTSGLGDVTTGGAR